MGRPKSRRAARSYLHTNCSHCHISAGGGNAQIVLSAETNLPNMKLVGGRPLHADFGISGAMLVAPGDPQRSVLFQRISRRGNGQMPPLATFEVDEQGARLIQQWIKEIVVPTEAQADVDRALAEVQGESGTLSRWYVAGPFQTAAPISKPCRKLPWPTTIRSRGAHSIGKGTECQVALNQNENSLPDSTWLARTDVILTEQTEIQLSARGNGPMQVWLNGRRLAAVEEANDRYDTTMQKGRNRLLVEIGAPTQKTTVFQANFRRKSANETHEQFTMAALYQTGNSEQGRTLFFDDKKSQCTKCHRVGNAGGNVGPNLTGIGGRLSTARIIESLLEPSRTVAPNYRVVNLELRTGRVVSGIVLSETSDVITIQSDQAQDQVISKSEIEVMQTQPQSLMPEGLEKTITVEEFADLVAYLSGLTTADATTGPPGIAD